MIKVVRLIHNNLVKRNILQEYTHTHTFKAAVTVLAKTRIEDSEIK